MENARNDQIVATELKEALKRFEGRVCDRDELRKVVEEVLLSFVALPGVRVTVSDVPEPGLFRVQFVMPTYLLRAIP